MKTTRFVKFDEKTQVALTAGTFLALVMLLTYLTWVN